MCMTSTSVYSQKYILIVTFFGKKFKIWPKAMSMPHALHIWCNRNRMIIKITPFQFYHDLQRWLSGNSVMKKWYDISSLPFPSAPFSSLDFPFLHYSFHSIIISALVMPLFIFCQMLLPSWLGRLWVQPSGCRYHPPDR